MKQRAIVLPSMRLLDTLTINCGICSDSYPWISYSFRTLGLASRTNCAYAIAIVAIDSEQEQSLQPKKAGSTCVADPASGAVNIRGDSESAKLSV